MDSDNHSKRWFALWIITTLLAVAFLGWAALTLELRVPPGIKAEGELSAPTEAMAENVYLIIVDGLRVDGLEAMPYVSKLAEEGSYGVVEVQEPTYSRPAYARIITGASSSLNGININRQARRLTLPTIFDLAVNSGLKTGASAFHWFYEIAVESPYTEDSPVKDPALPIQYGYYYGDYIDEVIFAEGKNIMQEFDPDFLIVHSMEVDYLGHQHGGRSEEYLDAAYRNDVHIRDFIESIPGPEESVVIITSDHGMYDFGHIVTRGGHGGPEREAVESPLVIIGKHVSGNDLEGYTQLDYAPTIAAILGLPFTSYMEGAVMTDAFNWPEEVTNRKTGLLRDIRYPFVESMYEKLAVDYARGEEISISRLAETVNNNVIKTRAIMALIILIAAVFISTAIHKRSGRSILKGKSRLILSSLHASVVYFVIHQLSFHYLFDFAYSYSVITRDIWLVIRLTGPAVIAFIFFFLVFRINMKTGADFNAYVHHLNLLLSAIIISAAAAFILQGGHKYFLPDFTWHNVLLFTLYHLGCTVILGFIAGKKIIKKSGSQYEIQETSMGKSS